MYLSDYDSPVQYTKFMASGAEWVAGFGEARDVQDAACELCDSRHTDAACCIVQFCNILYVS